MPINTESLNKKLFSLLKSQGLNPISKDSKDDRVPVPDQADVFQFSFPIGEDGVEKVYATIDTANNLIIYYDDDVFSSETPDGQDWYKLLRHLKYWALNNQLTFDLSNKDHLANDMAQREYMKNKEKLDEGYYPMGKSSSYSNDVPSIKIILQHTRQIQEGEQRFRNIAKIFLENTEGERILAPTTRPGLARIYARHLAEGGVPNDERWNHVKSLCEEYSKMAGFVRATKNKIFSESATSLIQEGLNHYNNLRETLGKLTGHRGYNRYFESWTPTLMEDDSEESTVNELFVQETLDPRIESVMPILNKLHKKINEMSEVTELEAWADSVIIESFKEEENTTENKETRTLQDIVDEYERREGKGTFHKKTHKYSDDHSVYLWGQNLHDEYRELKQKSEQNLDETKKKSTEEKLKDALKKGGYDMDKGSRRIDDIINRLKELEQEYYSDKKDKVSEAPGAETLKHNQDTEKSNLKAFGLAKAMDDDNPVVSSIVRRIMISHPELLQHGMENVFQAINDVADDVGDVEEIGSSDVSGWVRQVIDQLSARDMSEGKEFGAYYHEQLAQDLHDKNPDLDDDMDILTQAFIIAKADPKIGSRAKNIFNQEDFPSDLISAYHACKQGVAEGSLREFAPDDGGDSGDDGFSEETLKRFAAQWYNGDEDPRIERALAAAGWEIGQDEGYDDEPGVFVVQAGDVNGNSYLSWPAHELRQGVSEGYTVTRGIDKDRYQFRPGLEGPLSAKNGKVVYYDKVEGKYYDPDTDMYIDHEDWQAMNEENMAESDMDENKQKIKDIVRQIERLEDEQAYNEFGSYAYDSTDAELQSLYLQLDMAKKDKIADIKRQIAELEAEQEQNEFGSYAYDSTDAELQSLYLQLDMAKKGIKEGSVSKYKVKVIGHDAKGDYYISPSTGKKVYKSGVNRGDHENPNTGEIKKDIKEGGFFDLDQPNPGDMVQHKFNKARGKVNKISTQGDKTWVYFRDEKTGEMNFGHWKKHVFPVKSAGVAEDLDANQKRAGQLGPTERVKNNNIGKLVGTSESVDTGEYDARKKQPSSKEENDKVFAKHRERMKNLDKDDKKEVKEGQEDLNAILRIIRK